MAEKVYLLTDEQEQDQKSAADQQKANQEFKKQATKDAKSVISALRRLGRHGANSRYYYTKKDADAVIAAIRKELNLTKTKLHNRGKDSLIEWS